MTLETYIAFTAAAALLILVPGPSVMVVVSHSMNNGLKQSFFTILGVAFSHSIFFCITSLGLTTILLASAEIFVLMKWAGAVYLIWLGIKQFREKPEALKAKDAKMSASKRSNRSLFLQGFLVNMTNPKALIFYAVFFPPFLNPGSALAIQLVILGATFIAILIIISFIYAMIAYRTRVLFKSRRSIKIQNRVTGSLLISAGLILAGTKK